MKSQNFGGILINKIWSNSRIPLVGRTQWGMYTGGGDRLKLGNEEQTLETFPLIYIDDINYYPHPLPSYTLVLCFNTVSNIFRQIQNPLPTNTLELCIYMYGVTT